MQGDDVAACEVGAVCVSESARGEEMEVGPGMVRVRRAYLLVRRRCCSGKIQENPLSI